MNYVLTLQAEGDLRNIYIYGIENWGADKSQQYLKDLYSKFGLLADTPNMGRRRNEIGQNIQSFAHGSHIILYTQWERELAIVRVLHNSQDVTRAFNNYNPKRDPEKP